MAKSKQGAQKDGVTVLDGKGGGLVVQFAFHPLMVGRIAKVSGAEYDGLIAGWNIPVESVDAGKEAVGDLRKLYLEDQSQRRDIEALAKKAAIEAMKANGTRGVEPVINDFHSRTRPTVGEIISANGGYAAQLTGFGTQDGAAFVTLHRRADLDNAVFKGDRVSILYNDKGRGGVAEVGPAFDQTLGVEHRGVTVEQRGDQYIIAFDFNRAMMARLNRVQGVEYDEKLRAHTAPASAKEFVVRAVGDMRRMWQAEQEAIRELAQIAAEKLDGPKLVQPLRNGSHPYSGPAVAMNDLFVLQHTGKEYFTLHRIDELSTVPPLNDVFRVKYDMGRGQVSTSNNREVSHGR